MAGNDTQNVVSLADLGIIEKVAVNEKALEILIEDFKEHKVYIENKLGDIDSNTAEIFALIRTMPDRINTCRDQLEADIHLELEKYYASESTLRAIETELNNKIDRNNTRFKWTVTGIVGTFTTIQFVAGMWYISLQISKLTGG